MAALPAGLKGSSIDCRVPALDILRGAMLMVGGHDTAFDGGAPLPVSASALVGGVTLIANADERPSRQHQRSGMRCLSDRERGR